MPEVVPVLSVMGLVLDVPASLRRSSMYLRSGRDHSIVHDDSKALACDMCDKRFGRKQELTYHMNSHTGNRPYKCEVCSKSYVSHSSLYHHKKACTKNFT